MNSSSDTFRFYKARLEYLKGLTDEADLRSEVSVVVFSQGLPGGSDQPSTRTGGGLEKRCQHFGQGPC